MVFHNLRDTGSLTMAFVTMRENALHSDPGRPIGPPVTLSRTVEVWSWVHNETDGNTKIPSNRCFLT